MHLDGEWKHFSPPNIQDVSRETQHTIPDMTDPGIIYQRTNAGRDEIHQKSHGLTQSERLILIMVDGVSSCKEIRAKLPVLTDERFERALQKLQLKELVLEVFMPLEGQAPEELERTVIDRFLQQDPMDPVTIMLRDPEEELGLITPVAASQSQKEKIEPALATSAMPVLDLPLPNSEPDPEPESRPATAQPAPKATAAPRPTVPEPAMDAHHAQMADSLAEELRAIRAAKPLPVTPVAEHRPASSPVFEQGREASPFAAVHWGYWLIVSGSSFILGFVLAKITG